MDLSRPTREKVLVTEIRETGTRSCWVRAGTFLEATATSWRAMAMAVSVVMAMVMAMGTPSEPVAAMWDRVEPTTFHPPIAWEVRLRVEAVMG